MDDNDSVYVRFSITNTVKVRRGSPPTHFRTPSYIQDKIGVIVAHCGNFLNPESLAHGGDGLPKQPLYRVSFYQSEVWVKYQGESQDRILVDIYQHWLDTV